MFTTNEFLEVKYENIAFVDDSVLDTNSEVKKVDSIVGMRD